MALSASTLAEELKALLLAGTTEEGPGPAGMLDVPALDALCASLAAAVVDHIVANAVVTVTVVDDTGTGGIT